MKDVNFVKSFHESPHGNCEGTWRLAALRWEDLAWMLILSGLATLWIVLLMSPSWR